MKLADSQEEFLKASESGDSAALVAAAANHVRQLCGLSNILSNSALTVKTTSSLLVV
jgi:hypothetical protein